MEAALARILAAEFPRDQSRFFLPMVIGSTVETANEGAALILAGAKTLTSSPFWDYADGRIPFVGALGVLLDGARAPRGIVETREVRVLPFRAVTEAMARDYGEGDGTVGSWRRVMGAWYQASASRHGAVFTEETPIIWEWFAVVRRLDGPDPRGC